MQGTDNCCDWYFTKTLGLMLFRLFQMPLCFIRLELEPSSIVGGNSGYRSMMERNSTTDSEGNTIL